MPSPTLDLSAFERGSPLETPLPQGPSSASAEDARPSLDSTIDLRFSASKQATQAALLARTRITAPPEEVGGGAAADPTAIVAPPIVAPPGVPAPGLFIADAPLEPRPRLPSLVTAQRALLSRMRAVVLALGGVTLLLAAAVGVLLSRKSSTAASDVTPSASASSSPTPVGCSLALPPARISSAIERSVPIGAVPLADGTIAIGIADTKTSAVGWIYDPETAEPLKALSSPGGAGDVTYVTPSDPALLVDRNGPDFAFTRSLGPSLSIGVGPSGLLRRGPDGATGVVWPLATGLKLTPPRVAARPDGYFVAFRQGGAEGQLSTGWMGPTGTALAPLSVVPGAPKSLGTPSVAATAREGIVVFAGRAAKPNPFRIYAARAGFGQQPGPASPLDLTEEGGGAIAPSLTALPNGHFLVQWTDGKVAQYRVHVRILDANFAPVGDSLLVSAKGANAGQGTLVATGKSVVSLFIQTTAGHDELWGASIKCR